MIERNAIGIVGAGKVGASLGAYLKAHGLPMSGFYDVNPAQAVDAAEHTESHAFPTLEALLAENEVVLVTVPDDLIGSVWEACRHFSISGKTFVHCSGALSSAVFTGSAEAGVHVGSAHPLCAVSSRLSEAVFFGKFFVLEGDETGTHLLKSWMMKTANPYKIIASAEKARYHAAAVMSSNLFCALQQMGEATLAQCGFEPEEAHRLLSPLMLSNASAIAERGCVEALTGPVERGDAGTVASHLEVLEGTDRETYRLLSLRLVEMAQQKHPDRAYNNLLKVLKR